MTPEERLNLVEWLEDHKGQRRKMLTKLGIAESTYYLWRSNYRESGPKGLERRRSSRRVPWNALTDHEIGMVLDLARDRPELSPRQLAFNITDFGSFTVSESTVFRILKAEGLIRERPAKERPASKEYRHKTSRPNEMWQIDGSQFTVVNWGYYKWIPILDDYSRKLLHWRLMPDESADSITEVVQETVEKLEIGRLPEERKPVLLSDNGSGFTSKLLGAYLKAHGIRQIHGRPYHPQTQGKVERLNRRFKEAVTKVIYESPGELEDALKKAAQTYNNTPHEAIKNVTPNEMYEGRQEEVLARREAKKRWTIAQRRKANEAIAA